MREMKYLRWHDFIIAGIMPGLIFGWTALRSINISPGFVFDFLLCYSILIGIIYILNRNPKLYKDIEKGARR